MGGVLQESLSTKSAEKFHAKTQSLKQKLKEVHKSLWPLRLLCGSLWPEHLPFAFLFWPLSDDLVYSIIRLLTHTHVRQPFYFTNFTAL
jgi:hypothetical protein